MQESLIPIQPAQFMAYASKAVNAFIQKQYSTFFTIEDMEDIVAEVVARMWRARNSFNPAKGTFSTWVGTIARNAVKSAAESKWHRAEISVEFEDGDFLDNCTYSTFRSEEYAADGDLILEETQAELYARLKSERDRRFLAWQIEGLDAKEMASREGITVENVHMVLFHMRERLRKAA